VQAAIAGGLVVVALGQPLSGFVFVVDGVLIGAGDGPWLARAMLATLVAYLPVILGVHLAGDWLLEGGTTRGDVNAVVWLWIAFTAFMSLRGTLMWWRVRTDRGLVTGACPAGQRAGAGPPGLSRWRSRRRG
jgi:Na+-driven multidrug efflux pump